MAQYQNQETDTGMMMSEYSLYSFVTCLDLCYHHHNQDTDLFYLPQDLPNAIPL